MQSYSYPTKACFLKKFHTTLIISMHNKFRKGERWINRNGGAVWLAPSQKEILWVFAPSCKVVPSKTKCGVFNAHLFPAKWAMISAVVLWFWRSFSSLEKCRYCGDDPWSHFQSQETGWSFHFDWCQQDMIVDYKLSARVCLGRMSWRFPLFHVTELALIILR